MDQELITNPYRDARQEPVSCRYTPRLLAVCHTCQKKHVISEHDFLKTDALRNWEMKHRRHRIEFLCPDAYEVSLARHAVDEYRHNADIKIAYAADADYTITLGSLPESSTRLTGRESSAVDNTSNLYLDYMIAGRIATHAASSPTAGEIVEVGAVGSEDDTPTWPSVFDGTDSAETITTQEIKNHIIKFLAFMTVSNAISAVYSFGPVSLAGIFGVVPTHHVVWVSQSTDQNLAASGSVITHHGVYATAS